MKKKLFPIFLLLLLIGNITGFAQILSYTNATTGALSSVAANITGTALTRVNGANAPGSPCSTGFSSTNFSSTTTYATSLAAVEVSATPAASYKLSVANFSVGIRRSSTGPASVRLAYSTDGGTTWTDQGTNQAPNNSSCGSMATVTWATAITVTAPGTLKFRIYGFNASGTSGTFQIMNLSINGAVSLACTPPTLSTSVTNVTCNGGSNGAINLTVTGGTSPYTYSWSSSATTQNISGRTAGTYSVAVTDASGCTGTTSASITQPSAIVPATSVINASCGNSDGAATATATGGTPGYTYSWNTSPVQSTATASAIPYGTYTVTVTDANGCTASSAASVSIISVIGLSASSITSSSATLAWTDTGSADSYNIQYRPTGTSTWSSTSSAFVSAAITGLLAGTTYEFQVQPVCSSGPTGSFSPSTTFTTAGASSCVVPSGLSASSIGTATATLNWSTVSGAAGYNVQYRQTGTTTWSTTSSTTTSVAVSSLSSSTTYEFQVQTVCSGSTSAFSSSADFTTSSGATCDPTLWSHVYTPSRLQVYQDCMAITGTVANKINEPDGDIHIRVTVDAPYAYMINASNVSGQHGDLVCEPICHHTITQASAIGICDGFSNTVYIPNIGEHVEVVGSYVNDNNHGWNEIHPITSITIVSSRASSTADNVILTDEQVQVYPNPASSVLHFKLDKKPSSIVYITVTDVLGRVAGKYSMLETQELKMNASYLPNGKYFYTIMQDNKLIRNGSVAVWHGAQ